MRRGMAIVPLIALTGCGCLSRAFPFHGSSVDPETERLLRGLSEERRVRSRRPGQRYMLACTSVDRLVAQGSDAIGPLRRALDHEDPVVRRNAAIALARLGDESARAVLLAQLDDERLMVLEAIAVINALDSLPGVKDDATVQRVLVAAAGRNPALDCAVALEMGEIGNPAAAGFLAQALSGRPADPDARAAAAAALGRLGLQEAPAGLIRATEDGSRTVRAAAASSLAAIGDRAARPAVEKLLDDDSLEVQRAAIHAVGVLGGPDSVGRLLVFLDHRLPSVREVAVAALAALKSIVGLDHALLNDQWRVRRAAVAGLAAIGTDRALRALRRVMDDRSLTVRQEAVEALSASRRFAAVPLLLMALEDEAPLIRQAAHLGLCSIAGEAQPYDYAASEAARRDGIKAWERWWLTVNPETIQTPEAIAKREREIGRRIEAAIRDLGDTDPVLRGRAAHRLKGFGPRAVPALETSFDHASGTFPEAIGDDILPAISEVYRHIKTLRADDRRERRQAALALSRLDKADRVSRTAAAALVPVTEREPDAFTRRFLLDVVTRHTGEGVTRILVSGLTGPDAWERTKSARLLGQRRERSAVPVLIDALGDSNGLVRRAAVWALGRIGDARAIEPLRGMLTTADVELRLEVAGALAGFKAQAGIDELLRNLANPDFHLRQLAAEKCGEARVWAALPRLGGLLTDDRTRVRDTAVEALRAITNRTFGYRPADPPRDRDAAIRKWQAYIRQQTAQP